jgi:hypothetical protein
MSPLVTATAPGAPARHPSSGPGHAERALRAGGALALLVVGAVHLQQVLGNGYSHIPTIGTLFVLNFLGAVGLAAGLLLPTERILTHSRLRRLAPTLSALLALAGIGLSATSFIFLLISEQTPLFGFMEMGYRAAIVVALVAEAVSVLLLAGFLAVRLRRPVRG